MLLLPDDLPEFPDDRCTLEFPEDRFTLELPDDRWILELPDDRFTPELPDDLPVDPCTFVLVDDR